MLFAHALEATLVNTFVIWREKRREQGIAYYKNDTLTLRLELIRQMINFGTASRIADNDGVHWRTGPLGTLSGMHGKASGKAANTHWPELLAPRDALGRKTKFLRCADKAHKGSVGVSTAYKCGTCNVPLCPECMGQYHGK